MSNVRFKRSPTTSTDLVGDTSWSRRQQQHTRGTLAVASRRPACKLRHSNIRPDSRMAGVLRSTQPCIPPGSLNRVPASAGVRAGMSPLPGGS